MNKLLLLAYLLLIRYFSHAQVDLNEKQPGKESKAYSIYRLYKTDPPYGLQKIHTLINTIKHDSDGNFAVNQKTYLGLPFPEKFTYNIIHPESYSQNCAVMPAIQDEQKKIFAELPDLFGEYSWSEHQTKFFLSNRDTVIKLMQPCIFKQKRIGLNFKQVIVDVDAKEMIPLIVNTYNIDRKDHDLLTVLMLLMKDNEYAPFLLSAAYRKLYGDPDNSYKSYLVYNIENEQLIIKRATDFYNELPH